MGDYTPLFEFAALAVVAFVASTIAAITGTGGGILLLPVMVAILGVREAVPAYTLAQFIGNLSRVLLNRKELRFDVVAWFVAGAIPAAVLGSLLFAKSRDHVVVRALGLFLLTSVVYLRWSRKQLAGFPVTRFAPVGVVFGFVSAYLGSAGPFLAPFFLAFGLLRGAYIGTEALGTAIMHVTKMATYGMSRVFSLNAVCVGLAMAPAMIAGSLTGKRVLDRVPPWFFVTLIEFVLFVFGLLFLVRG